MRSTYHMMPMRMQKTMSQYILFIINIKLSDKYNFQFSLQYVLRLFPLAVQFTYYYAYQLVRRTHTRVYCHWRNIFFLFLFVPFRFTSIFFSFGFDERLLGHFIRHLCCFVHIHFVQTLYSFDREQNNNNNGKHEPTETSAKINRQEILSINKKQICTSFTEPGASPLQRIFSF